MIVMLMEHVSNKARGELARWLLEPYPGVFIGDVSGMVRDRLWERCCHACGEGGVVQIWSTNTEQGFKMRMYGKVRRSIVELEGLQLIKIP
jgi:CRISPR-associated protein Cas2